MMANVFPILVIVRQTWIVWKTVIVRADFAEQRLVSE